MQIDQRIAMCDDFLEKRVRDAGRRGAVGITREVAVQVTPVRQVTGTAAKTLHVDDRNADDGARHLAGIEVVHYAANHLDAVELIAVHGGRQAQGRPGKRAIEHQYRR